MNKFIEVMIVVGVLFLLAFVVGCKEEPVTGKELVHEQEVEFLEPNNGTFLSTSAGPCLWVDTLELPPPVIYYSDDNGDITEYVPKKEN